MTIESITQWFRTAVPQPDPVTLAIQIGCHFEEVAEMLAELDGGAQMARRRLESLADTLKSGYVEIELLDPVALLDALCDQIVTAIGVGHMMGFDMAAALDEVNKSNYSKFVNGHPVFDANGKIAKGPDYAPPDLERFALGGEL